MQELPREFYTVGELADLLQVEAITVYRLARSGQLPNHRIGRAIRFRRDDVEAYLGRVRVEAKAE